MVTRSMVDSVYDVLQVVLTASKDVIPAANIWNMDELLTLALYCYSSTAVQLAVQFFC